MNDRIHAWLDGELPFEALTPEEREAARRLEATVDAAADAAAEPSPGLASRVMLAIPAGAPARRRSLADRLRDLVLPRPLSLRPVMAVASLCLLLGFGLGLWAASGGGEPAGGERTALAADSAAATVFVRFDVRIPQADSVYLAGSFSNWEPRYALTPAGGDHWTVTVPLEPGVHDYVFVVDGERHVLDPAAPQIADGFGSYNNRIALLTSAT